MQSESTGRLARPRTIATAREYVSFQRDDPWVDYWKTKQSLAKPIKALATALKVKATG